MVATRVPASQGGQRPALPAPRAKRHIQAGSLPPWPCPELLRDQAMVIRCPSGPTGTVGRQRTLLTAPLVHWQAEPPGGGRPGWSPADGGLSSLWKAGKSRNRHTAEARRPGLLVG